MNLKLDKVINLDVEKEILIERITGRQFARIVVQLTILNLILQQRKEYVITVEIISIKEHDTQETVEKELKFINSKLSL